MLGSQGQFSGKGITAYSVERPFSITAWWQQIVLRVKGVVDFAKKRYDVKQSNWYYAGQGDIEEGIVTRLKEKPRDSPSWWQALKGGIL
jgi:hypothetical protein